MSEEDVALKPFIKAVKDELGLGKIRVQWIENDHQAYCLTNENVIAIPTQRAIVRLWGVPTEGARAKQKGAIMEEVCHLRAGRPGHSPEIYRCYRQLYDKYLTEEEKRLLEEKTERLRKVCEGILTPRKRVPKEPPGPSAGLPMDTESSQPSHP